MLNMQQHLSAIASLRNQLAAGHIANLTDFWREAESLNVPLAVSYTHLTLPTKLEV